MSLRLQGLLVLLAVAMRLNIKDNDNVPNINPTPEQSVTERATVEQVNPEELAEINARLVEIESMIKSIGGKDC